MRPLANLFVASAQNNAVGRAYVLGELLNHLGWRSRIVSLDRTRWWSVMATLPFEERCYYVDRDPSAWADADLNIAVKFLPATYSTVCLLRKLHGTPVVVDIDDADVLAAIHTMSLRQRLGLVNPRVGWRHHPIRLRRLHRKVLSETLTTSNPTLDRIYNGVVIPHARRHIKSPSAPKPGDLSVAFVGTTRSHKGLVELRAAIDRLASDGYRLVVTAEAPPDCRPWERWVGETTFEEGMSIVREASIVAIPSRRNEYSYHQLPAKLIDAMMLGRAVVASDLPPIRWALGGHGILVEPGSVDGLTAALRLLKSEALRSALGAAANRHAVSCFSVDAVAPRWAMVLQSALKAAQP